MSLAIACHQPQGWQTSPRGFWCSDSGGCGKIKLWLHLGLQVQLDIMHPCLRAWSCGLQCGKVPLCKAPLGSGRFVLCCCCCHLAGEGLKRIVAPKSPQHWGDKVCRALGRQGLHARWQGLVWQGRTWQLQTCVALELLALGRRRSQEHWGAKVFVNIW